MEIGLGLAVGQPTLDEEQVRVAGLIGRERRGGLRQAQDLGELVALFGDLLQPTVNALDLIDLGLDVGPSRQKRLDVRLGLVLEDRVAFTVQLLLVQAMPPRIPSLTAQAFCHTCFLA